MQFGDVATPDSLTVLRYDLERFFELSPFLSTGKETVVPRPELAILLLKKMPRN